VTEPVDDLISGVVEGYLLNQPDVVAALGAFPDGVPYLFQRDLWLNLEGTQSTAARLYRAGGWAGPNPHNTMRFPRLGLEITADPVRDAVNNAIGSTAEVEQRLDKVYKVFDRHLHRPANAVQMWGSVRTIGCARLGEPMTFPVADGGGLMRLSVFYGVIEA
jgi:hypothetical protein